MEFRTRPEMSDHQEHAPFEISRPDGGMLPRNHHLEYRKDKKTYRMKVAVNMEGSRFVGKRVVIPLHTDDLSVARQIRDGIIAALSKAGVLSRRVDLSRHDDAAEGDDSFSCE